MLAIMDTKDNFAWVDWIITKREEQGLSQADLAHLADLSRTAISDYENRKRLHPDWRALNQISGALGYPANILFKLAGIPTDQIQKDLLVNTITYLAEQLPTDDDKQDVADYIRHRLSVAEKRGKHETANSKRPKKTS